MATKWTRVLRGYVGLLVGLALTGLVAVGWGVQIDSVFLTSVGGAVFGAALGVVVAELNSRSALADVRALVAIGQEPELASREADIGPYRQVWHHYHRTMIDGELVWRYRQYDLRESRFPGRLITEVVARDDHGNEFPYDVRAAVRGQRFVMFETARSGSEPVVVEVYPSMGLDFMGAHSGIGVIQAWSGDNLLTACIMSKHRVIDWETEGNVATTMNDALNAAWRRGFHQMNALPAFPRSDPRLKH